MITVMPWRPALVILGSFGVAAALVIFAATPRLPIDSPAASPSDTAHPTKAGNFGFPVLASIGVIDSATRMAFLTFLPFVLVAKGASLPVVGFALTLVFAGGAAGKLVCAFLGARIGAIATVCLTEALTAAGIVALLPLSLTAGLALLPLIGVALNGTSSVLYGSVPDLVAADKRARAFGIFYTGTIGAGAIAPALYGLVGDALGVTTTLLLVAAMVLTTIPLVLVLAPVLARQR
jgi:MFS transporter, FSR family, fosmidomycin resistance protein